MNEARLRRLLQRVVLSAASIPVSTAGCGGKDESSAAATPHPEVFGVTDAGMSTDAIAMPADDAPVTDAATTGTGPFRYCTSSSTVVVDASTEPFRQSEGGVLENPECEPFCGPWASPLNRLCTLPDPMQPSLVECLVCGFGGRFPEGLVGTETSSLSDVGGHFAEMAHLEAASVEAFRVLGHELQHHRAPRKLVRAARRAACDEVRHSRAAAALARRYGSMPRTPCVEKRSVRSLEAIALDNAVEGCVRETYGAAVAMWQAEHASDPVVRATAARIARDEIRHAALGWQIASWLNGKLDVAARRRVDRARRNATNVLVRIVEMQPSLEMQRIAGVPPVKAARAMVARLATTLWS